jgi:eukaryotic-like serine/threonine-protein kinase
VGGAVEPAAAQEPQAPGTVARVPRDVRGVPAWLQRGVLRGLSWRPEDRHPGMEALLGALTREPARRRRRVMLALAATIAVVFGGGVVALATVADSDEPSCTGARELVSRTWNATVAARVRAAFAASDRPHAVSSAGRVAEQVDAYTEKWADMHRSACLATSRGEQSPDLLDRRMACLGRRLDQTAALLDLFVRRADGALVDQSLDLVAGLDPLSTCADSAGLLARVAPPADPARRATVTRLERQVDQADLEWKAGRPQRAVDEARAVLEASRPLAYPPLTARAGRVLGQALEDIGRMADAREALIDAQGQAEAAGDVKLAAHIMLDLLIVINLREKRLGEAQLVAKLIEALLERPDLRRNEVLRARLLAAQGSMAGDEGQADRAIALQREALAIRRRIDPPLSNEVANAEQDLGNALSRKARYAEARTHYFRTLAIRRQVFGDQHPLTANVHSNLGVTYILENGDAARTRKHFLAALAILERDPTYRSYPAVLANLAELEQKVGNLQKALTYHKDALAAYQRQFGPDHPDVATSLQSMGTVRREMGAFAEALAFHRRALAMHKKTAGADHHSYAVNLSEIGEDLRRLGRAAEALRHQEKALHILRARIGQHPMIGHQLAYKGLALVDLRRPRQAVPVLKQALETIPPGDANRARAAFALARALEPRRPRSARALALAREALAIFTALRASRERDEVARYLARGSRRATRRR